MAYRHQVLAVNLLRGNPWNPNVLDASAEKKLDESLKRLGVFKPIIARETEGVLEIIGGHHRWQSAKRIGLAEVPVINLGAITDKEAKEIGLADNGRWGHDDAGLLAEVFKDLKTDELMEFLPYSAGEIDSIFATSEIDLSELDLDDEDDIDLSDPSATKAPPTHTIMRFKVPVLDAEIIGSKLRKICGEQNFNLGDSMMNAGDALVFLLGDQE